MIRKLCNEDIIKCVEICEKTFQEEGYSYDIGYELTFSLKENCFDHEYYVYEEDGIIKGLGGLMNVGFDNGIYGLCSCYVLPEYQKQGIGRKLTEYRLNRIKELNADIVFATTKKTWHLERFGFRVIKTKYTTWSVMQLDL